MPLPLLFPIAQVLALGAGAAWIAYKEWYEPNYGVPELPVPPETPPAAPQEYTQLTNPQAWNPSIMFAQTQANRQLVASGYAEGYKAGGGGARLAEGGGIFDKVGDFLGSNEALMGAMVIGGVLLLRNLEGGKGKRRRRR